MAGLEFRAVTRRFGAVTAVDAVSLDAADGEFLALLGPSGCGKTTLLRLAAGFERPDGGEVRIGGATMAGPGVMVPPERRRIGMVFQSYALWPHMTVRRNVAYPLEVQGVRRAEAAGRVDRALHAVGLHGLAERRPADLSGGQRQRVALARCLVMAPRVVLLDEPLANLDVHLRASLQAELAAFHREAGATTVFVTHDQAEALALADRVAVMDRGRLVQVAAPETLYREPATAMVAGFVGRGAVVPVRVRASGGGEAAATILGQDRRLRCHPGQQPGAAHACLRPEDLAPAEDGTPATVLTRVFQGSHFACDVQVAGAVLALHLPPGTAPAPGATLRVAVRGGWVIPDRSPD